MIDGLSNTLLVGEKKLALQYLGQYPADDNEGYTAGWNHDTMRYTTLQPRIDHATIWGEDRFGLFSEQNTPIVCEIGEGTTDLGTIDLAKEKK